MIGKGPRSDGADRNHEPAGAVSAADFLRDGGGGEELPSLIPVLEENWTAVQLFTRCKPRWITGMHAPIYDGIEAREIQAAACLLGIDQRELPDLMPSLDVLIGTTATAHREASDTP
ncbi:hypothetical protein EF148_03225 [Stenotrophomonas maltophilia]|nr:hypothetical protein [Stenotrophomonas maltophilia]MBH1527578.1 DUF1799 domain-containing protein [Stenotrophomonas maltophilia]